MDEQGHDAFPRAAGAGVRPPHLIIFDVNETLSDMSVMGQRFSEVGAPSHLAATWFAGLLRDGFALTAAGTSAAFAELGAGLLRVLLIDQTLDRGIEEAVEHITHGLDNLTLHPDVVPGVVALHERGQRLVTLSNGAASVAADLLERAGIRDRFEQLLSVEEAGVWKPGPGSYRYVLERCGVSAAQAMLVAVHPWDVDGASRAGLSTAWLNRDGKPYPGYFRPPGLEVQTVGDLAQQLARAILP